MRKYLAVLFFISIASCKPVSDSINQTSSATSAPTVASTISPIFIPTFTSTPQPPLKEHEWTPETVLLRLDFTRGNDEGILIPPAPPHFMLYADGNLFLKYPLIGGKPYGDQQILSKKLERGEVCRILNTLDQTGFLDYNPIGYEFIGGKPNVSGASGAYIQVNAWKSHKKTYAELPLYILEELTGEIASSLAKSGRDVNNRGGFPEISSALRNAYYLFVDYPVEGFEVYEPKKLAVWIRPLDPQNFTDIQWEEWHLAALSPTDMFSRIDFGDASFDERYLTLSGTQALALYKFLDESFSTKYYVETDKRGEKKYYAFHARPLLPYEQPGTYSTEIPAPVSASANLKLKCSPSDGVMPIPSPNLIYNLPSP